jgi:hypothetical protein
MPDLPRLLPDFKLFQLAYVALRLGIPAALAGGRKTLAELASETRVPEVRLLRLLRGLVWAEILAMDSARGLP